MTPYYWIDKADQLVLSSKKLEPSIKKYWEKVRSYIDLEKGKYNPPLSYKPKPLLEDTYFLLIAYALENYIKAILVYKNKDEYSKDILRDGILPKDLQKNGHDLLSLLKKLKIIELSESEKSILNRLYRHSTWQGRYPVPVNADHYAKANTGYDRKSFDFKTIGYFQNDVSQIQQLIKRLKKLSSKKVIN